MSGKRFALPIGLSLLLIKKNKILLIRRYNTGWEDGKYSLVGGHVEENETFADAMAREAKEEINLTIKAGDLKVVHIMHTATGKNYMDVFLVATEWAGTPEIIERDKIDDLQWFPLDNLPQNMPKVILKGITSYQQKEFFAEFND